MFFLLFSLLPRVRLVPSIVYVCARMCGSFTVVFWSRYLRCFSVCYAKDGAAAVHRSSRRDTRVRRCLCATQGLQVSHRFGSVALCIQGRRVKKKANIIP